MYHDIEIMNTIIISLKSNVTLISFFYKKINIKENCMENTFENVLFLKLDTNVKILYLKLKLKRKAHKL